MRWVATLSQRFAGFIAPRPLGRRGEDAAARYLKKLGYIIVARGHRDNIGEIDLVAVDGRTVIFIEVKTGLRPRGSRADAKDIALRSAVSA